MNKKTCFVIIGFGVKVDYSTGRTLDLDKTFENLIKPVFDDLSIDCFRAIEIRHSGTIDVPMYEWIYKADIVVADISTLNPNALYELGVRHALRPYSTIVISENQLEYPFDISHTVIEPYEHLGKDIGVSEANRFKKELKQKVEAILKNKQKDSPVYTYLPDLKPPTFEAKELQKHKEEQKKHAPFSELIEDAERLKNNNEFLIAAELYKACLKFEANNIFLKQRLALVTYKSKKPNTKQALLDAEKILNDLNPEKTTDVETLGLSGAINKRLYEETNDIEYLNKALWFYERGFYIQQDYYNGINYAYLLNIQANLQTDRYQAISYYIQGKRVREKIILICNNLIKQKNFRKRDDHEWIYQSLAQAYLGLNKDKEVTQLIPIISKLSKGKFDLDTFKEQNKKLINMLKVFQEKYNYQ